MSDSEDDDLPREKVKKTLLRFSERQSSKSKLDYKGVKSYLHQFYEYAKDPNSTSDGEFLVKSRRVRVRSIYWRVVLVLGLFLMLLGLFAVLLSYVLPPRSVVVEEDEEIAVVDKEAAMFNRNLEYLKLTGLATFCIGGIGSSLALLMASCCFRRCNVMDTSKGEDMRPPVQVAKKLVEDGEENEDFALPPLSPVDVKIPGQESVFGVQPSADGNTSSDTAYPIPIISTSTAL